MNFVSDAETDEKEPVIKSNQNVPLASGNKAGKQIKLMQYRKSRNITRESFSIEFVITTAPSGMTFTNCWHFHRARTA